MICAFDIESRGLWGDIFKVGFFDGTNYFTFETGNDFIFYLMEYKGKENLEIFAFNLEFDLSKLMFEQPLDIDFNKSLIINKKFHTAKIKGKNIYFRDIQPLCGASLEKAAKSFGLDTQKMEIKGDKNEYFNTVSTHCPELLKYLKSDVKATHELVLKLMNLSGLAEKDFLKCPTVASLAMRVFKTNFNSDYEKIKKSGLSKNIEGYIREGYFGGRTEVFKPVLKKEGYHYDVNSLYPSVMTGFKFPTGRARISKDFSKDKKDGLHRAKKFLKTLDELDNYYFADVAVYVPSTTYIPVLPFKTEKNKLIFPVGNFSGIYCKSELEYAIEEGAKITSINQVVWWEERQEIFTDYIKKFMDIKMNNSGAKKNFAKSMLNNLYGKFGMQRKRDVYEEFTENKTEKLDNKKTKYSIIKTCIPDTSVLRFEKLFFGDYIRPQFSAIITALSRVELAKQLHRQIKIGGDVWYCDTDSLVSDKKMLADFTHHSIPGKWKLEKIIKEGLFIAPKLYAEITVKEEEILKSKGIIKQHMEKINFNSYRDYYTSLVNESEHVIYDYDDKYYNRTKIITAIEKGGDTAKYNAKIPLRKTLKFKADNLKRKFDFKNNSSVALILGGD